MHLGLEKKVILVTGSTAGIGRAIATVLAREGATVILNGRSKETVNSAVAALKTETGSADIHGIPADVSTAAGVASLPPLYGLINNTGIFESKPFEEIQDDEWQKIFDVSSIDRAPDDTSFFWAS